MHIEIPECPPECTQWGKPDLFKSAEQEHYPTFRQKAIQFLQENPDQYWVIYRTDFPQPLESGTCENRLEALNEEETTQNFRRMETKHGLNKDTQTFLYFQRPSSIRRVTHATQHLRFHAEGQIVTDLKEKGLF